MRWKAVIVLAGLVVACSQGRSNRSPAGWVQTRLPSWSASAPCVLDLPPGAGPTATVWQCQAGSAFFRVESEPFAADVDDAGAFSLLHQRAAGRKLAAVTRYAESELHAGSYAALDIEWSASTPVRITSIERELITRRAIFRIAVSSVESRLPEDANQFAALFEVAK